MIHIKVIFHSRHHYIISISLFARVHDLLLEIERRSGIKVIESSPFWLSPVIHRRMQLIFGHNHLSSCNNVTLQDAGLYDNACVFVTISTPGGGRFASLLSECSSCPSPINCDFDDPHTTNMLCNKDILVKLVDEMIDVYKEFGRLFGFEHEMDIIEKNSDSNYVRLTDVLHRQYHVKQQSLTWEDIRNTASKHNRKLAEVIDRATLCVSME